MMYVNGRLIERYVLAATVPYILLSLSLLTTILFAQQSSRFAELLLGSHVPTLIAAQISLALVPSVLVFTLPMATLAGVLIGLSRMGGDSELIAMRAAGIGTGRLLKAVLLVGLLATIAATYINMELAPRVARTLRRSLMSAAVYKLNSPIEPGAFNAEIPRYLIYVRDGDKESGRWGRVFIYSEADNSNTKRIVTARSGRIDSSTEKSELVLNDAVSIELPKARGGSYVSTRLAQLRVQLDTGRDSLLARLRSSKPEFDEMSWGELTEAAKSKSSTAVAARDALTLQQKRATLSLSPLLFSLLGAGLGLRIKKGGRGAGILLSLLIMVAYYLIALTGEQLSRAGTVPLVPGMWSATAATLFCSVLLLCAAHYGGSGIWRNVKFFSKTKKREKQELLNDREVLEMRGRANIVGARLISFPILLDVSLARALAATFGFAFFSLTAVVLIFTLSELWRAIIESRAGIGLVAQYLFFLLPFVSVQIIPASALLAALAAYALLARRSEAVAWWASGQSVYRLMIPGVVFAVFISLCGWLIQERLMPQANQRQEDLRALIKHRAPRTTTQIGRQWLAETEEAGEKRLYAYEYDENTNSLVKPTVYEFDAEGVHLKRIIESESAVWKMPHDLLLERNLIVLLNENKIKPMVSTTVTLSNVFLSDSFKPTLNNPNQLSAPQLSAYIKNVHGRGDSVRVLMMALQSKYADPLGALVLSLVGIPLGLSFGRRSTIVALCFAVAIGLTFWATLGAFRQLGVYGLLPVTLAAWSPIAIFACAGVYLLARART